MTSNPFPVARSVLIVAAVVSVLWVSAGSLSPPGGAIAPTMKDLDDVEPRTAIRNDFDTITPIVISSPGSYYLAEDILAIPSQHGIEIDASHVTLDLNGFTVYGNTEVGSLDGIHIVDGRDNITIKNGTVRDFFQYGIYAFDSDGAVVDNVRAINNGSYGIRLGDQSRVKDCLALSNGEDGISVSARSVITGSVAWDNGSDNFDAGIRVGADSGTVFACTSSDNAGWGIRVGSGTTISSCTARNNTGNGLDASSVGHVVDSTATGNAINISATSTHNSYGP